MSDQKFLYFTYGSNMLCTRLQARCSSTVTVGTGIANHHKVTFNKQGSDNSSKATLTPAQDDVVHGVLFKIDRSQLDILDKAEGCGHGYRRDDRFYITTSNKVVSTVTYIATHLDDSLLPYDWYLSLVIGGAHEHALPDRYIEQLKNTAYQPDTDIKRQETAMTLLRAAGYHDTKAILNR